MRLALTFLAIATAARGAGPAALAQITPAAPSPPASAGAPAAAQKPAALSLPSPVATAQPSLAPTPQSASAQAPAQLSPVPQIIEAAPVAQETLTPRPAEPAAATAAPAAAESVSEPQPAQTSSPLQSGATGIAAAASVSSIAQAWGHSGFLYAFSASNWSVFNGSPLGYTPFEFGYDFGNGLRLQSGIDLIFYQGKDVDEKNPSAGQRNYDFEMSNWRSSVLYRVPMPIRLRPLLGLSVNAFGGSRKLAADFQSGRDINADAKKTGAWSYIGLGTQLGLEYLLNADWSLQLSGRYDFTFTSTASPVVTQLGLAVTF